MEVPTARELELETLLRQRDTQLRDLSDEISTLRRYLSNQPAPSPTEPVPLPPALVSLFLAHVSDPLTTDPSELPSSNSVVTALTQRAKLLKEENDELYELLKRGETGRLKEEVRGLRRALSRMERALTESHTMINSLSTELEKYYDTLARPSSDAYASSGFSHTPSEPSRMHATQNGPRPIPTAPRAHKRPRLEQPQPPSPQQTAQMSPVSPRANRGPLEKPRQNSSARRSGKMDVDEGRARASPGRERGRDRERHRDRSRDWARERDRGADRDLGRDRVRDPPPHQASRRSKERDRDRDRERERDRNRERERERGGRRSGVPRERRGARGSSNTNGAGNRGLAERMGL